MPYLACNLKKWYYSVNTMKYASVFVTILIVWIAAIIISLFVLTSTQRLQLFILVTLFTLVLFVIGFGQKRR